MSILNGDRSVLKILPGIAQKLTSVTKNDEYIRKASAYALEEQNQSGRMPASVGQ